MSDVAPFGQPASGGPDLFVGAPVIDGHGNVAFLASHGPTAAESSVWISSSSGLRRVARSGESAPNTGTNFARFSDLVIAGNGVVAFKATLDGSPIGLDDRESVWLERMGVLTLTAETGQAAPDMARDLRFSAFETPVALNGDGQLAFFARARDKEDTAFQESGLWLVDASGLVQVASSGGMAIAGEPDIKFSPQSFEQPFANDPIVSAAGQTIFRGFLTGPGIDETNLNGLWSYERSTGLQLLLRAGDEAPGTGGQPFVSFPGLPTINAAGDTAFLAYYGAAHEHNEVGGVTSAAGGGLATELSLGLWMRRSGGELTRVYSIGEHAPGIVGDVHFVDTFDPVMNKAGRVAFLAAVGGDGIDATNEVGLWSNGMSLDGVLGLVARAGERAPGMGEGFVYGVFLEPSLNAAGQAAFMAAGYRQEEGMILDSAFGIWGQDRLGRLQLVARVGQLLGLGPGDEREIASLAFASETGGADGKARGLDDRGILAFRATFTDGTSGIFVSNALTVPEPGSVLLVLAVIGIQGMRRSRPGGDKLAGRTKRN